MRIRTGVTRQSCERLKQKDRLVKNVIPLLYPWSTTGGLGGERNANLKRTLKQKCCGRGRDGTGASGGAGGVGRKRTLPPERS